jgi:hypothetical protein
MIEPARKYRLTASLLLSVLIALMTLMPSAATAEGTVIMRLIPSAESLSAGSTFDVNIQIEAGSQEVAGADAFVNFDPLYLAAITITPDKSKLGSVANNSIDNENGHADYSALKTIIQPDATGTFNIATITFRGIRHNDDENPDTTISFSQGAPRNSVVARAGESVLGSLIGCTVNQIYDVPLRLEPPSNSGKVVGQDFSINIQVSLAEGQKASGVDAFINFDPLYLEAITITPDKSKLASVANNSIDNENGHASYSALKTIIQPDATGIFNIATITFRGKQEVASTPITFSMTEAGRKSTVAYTGNVVYGTHSNATVELTAFEKITGTATLQGDNRPPEGLNVPLTLRVYTSDTTLNISNILTEQPAYEFSTASQTVTITQTDSVNKTITFETASGILPGTYHISLSTPHCLINLKNNVAIGLGTSVDMGTLLSGNTEDSVQIDAADFTLMLNDYLMMEGGAKWNNGRCDFDRDGQVTSIDFSAMAKNYGLTSPNVIQ